MSSRVMLVTLFSLELHMPPVITESICCTSAMYDVTSYASDVILVRVARAACTGHICTSVMYDVKSYASDIKYHMQRVT